MKHKSPTVPFIATDQELEDTIACAVEAQILLTKYASDKDLEIASIERAFTQKAAPIQARIAAYTDCILEYCLGYRTRLFGDAKSRETSLATYGWELTPPSVQPSSKKLKWKDIVTRLARLPWGRAYLRQPDPQPDKDALLADRAKLTPEQLTAAGIQFKQTDQFYIRPKPETAKLSAQ